MLRIFLTRKPTRANLSDDKITEKDGFAEVS